MNTKQHGHTRSSSKCPWNWWLPALSCAMCMVLTLRSIPWVIGRKQFFSDWLTSSWPAKCSIVCKPSGSLAMETAMCRTNAISSFEAISIILAGATSHSGRQCAGRPSHSSLAISSRPNATFTHSCAPSEFLPGSEAYIILYIYYIVMAYVVMAYILMAYMLMAYILMAYMLMAYVVMAYIVIREGQKRTRLAVRAMKSGSSETPM